MPIVIKKRSVTQAVFAPVRKSREYLYDHSKMSTVPNESGVSVPLNIDTEYRPFPKHWVEEVYGGRKPVTTQIRGIHTTEGKIFVPPNFPDKLARHPKATSGFHPVDYLRSLGADISIKRTSFRAITKDTPTIEFVLYAHFALAELMMIVDGEFRDDFLQLVRTKATNKNHYDGDWREFVAASGLKPQFKMTRRLSAETEGKFGKSDNVPLPWIVTLEGIDYAVKVAWFDTCALHGQASYKDLCEATGIELEDKDNFTNEEKAIMDEMYVSKPKAFDPYALGDLYPYDILVKNAENFKRIYGALTIEQYQKDPKLTIGATIRDLFMGALCNHIGIKASDDKAIKELVAIYLAPVSAGNLRTDVKETSALAAKVEGGRCRNNRPTSIYVASPMVDLDISGCYGEGQRNQEYFIGVPEIMKFSTSAGRNQYPTLREFLKMYKDELVSGAWFARVSTSEKLKYPQDYFASWFLPTGHGEDIMAKYVAKMSSDTENEATDEPEFNEEDGSLKIFNYEILNGTLNHDGLQWILNVASPRQREELLDKLQVKTSVVYPASLRVESYEAVREAHKKHEGANTVTRVTNASGRKHLRRDDDGQCHAWYGVNLGELIIDDLLANRKLYKKKTPLNTLYKLCVNTLYGDMTSKFFESANVVVGNNITARARALAWYMEKGLHGFQTITDGCAFELNRVVFPVEGRRVNGENLVNLYRERDPKNKNLRLAPLGGKNVEIEWIELTHYDSDKKKSITAKYPKILGLTPSVKSKNNEEYVDIPAMDWVNIAAMEHLQSLFNVDVLQSPSTSLTSEADEKGNARKIYKPRKGQFIFEAKDYYDWGVFHGSSNYKLSNPNGENLKMRAYETKKAHEAVESEYLTVGTRYGTKNNPATDFMSQIAHPETVERQTVFVKDAILKPSDFKNRYETFAVLGKVPGDSFYKAGLLREFSISQFTYQTLEQYIAWENAISKAKDKTGQSAETFFINDDESLNYAAMIVKIDGLIAQGEMKPLQALDPNRHKSRDLDANHPGMLIYTKMKEHLKTPSNPD